MLKALLNSQRSTKRILSVVYDSTVIPLAIFLALSLRHGEPTIDNSWPMLGAILITTISTIVIFIKLGLYRAVIRYMTEQAFMSLVMGMILSSLFLATSSFLLQAPLPRSATIIYIFTGFVLIGLPRLFVRGIINQLESANEELVLIYGAGKQGIALVNALTKEDNYKPCTIIDDNPQKQGSIISGLKVQPFESLPTLMANKKYKKILLALGDTSRADRQALVSRLEQFPLEVLTTPSVQDIVSGKSQIDEIKEVEIEDILGRDSIAPDKTLLENDISGKNVLITGAGGSIGSELCRQVLLQKPAKLVLLELNEYSLYAIEQELNLTGETNGLQTEIISILGSVQRQSRLENIFKTFQIQTIYHAAAYKHVPMVEHNVVEGVRNNVFGTWFCAEAAIIAGVEKFVLISTDKAVRPTNVMGASKRLAELVLQALSKRQTETLFTMVRFGNVLGSSGSVVPLFRKQIKKGKSITVTHPDITRYFMTIPEASQLVIQAGAMGKGGDVFVLDMGEPIKIVDLAKKMIHLSGLTERTDINPSGDISIEYTGLRPGEKLYEELLIGDDVAGSGHPRIMTANEIHLTWPETHNLLNRLDKACHDFKVQDVIDLLLEAPAAFDNQGECPDWVYKQNIRNDA